jgi:hypothetical protein
MAKKFEEEICAR